MKLSRRAVAGLVLAAVLVVLGWKVLEGHLTASPSPLAKRTPAAVRAACLAALGQNLGGQVDGAGPEAPAWDGERWAWSSAARVDGDPLRFACTLTGSGAGTPRAIIRVLN